MEPDIEPVENEMNLVDSQDNTPVETNVEEDLSVDVATDDIVFESGNLEELQTYSSAVLDKYNYILRTFLPIVEIALIELYGDSNKYNRKALDMSFNKETLQTEILATYVVKNIIGVDIDVNLIASDANYIMTRITPVLRENCKITECKIDCSNGNITVGLIC